MGKQSNNLPQIFHMSLAEPLILAVIIPILGVILSVWLLLTKPIYFGVWVPIVILILCVLAIFQGMMMPTKMELQDREIVISYLVRKRTVTIGEITKYFLDEEKAGRGAVSGTRSFVTLQLNAGKKISFKNIKGSNDSLLETLEKWTGLESAAKRDLQAIMEQQEVELERQKQILQNRPDVSLSIQNELLIQEMFPHNEHDKARQLLIQQLGKTIYPDFKDRDELEDIRISVIKKSKGDLEKLNSEINQVLLRLEVELKMNNRN